MFSVDKGNVLKEMQKLKKSFKLFLKKNAGLLKVISLHFPLLCFLIYYHKLKEIRNLYSGNCL